MKKNHYHWTVPLTGMVLFGTAVSAEQDKYTYLNSTNRLTLSLRFGLNIHSKFTGVGSSFAPGSAAGGGRLTPFGDLYNYDDGYVLTTSSSSPNPNNSPNPAFTTYWGYDSVSQLVPAGGGLFSGVALSSSTATGISAGQPGDSHQSYPGLELTYDRQLGIKENWFNLHYGIEGAVNYMKISLNDNSISSATVSTTTDVYQFPIGLSGPFPFDDNGFISSPALGVPFFSRTTASAAGTFLSQDHFNADLLGFRLGPYVELPLNQKLELHLSGGLAVGLLYGSASWRESLALSSGASLNASGGGSAFDTLWGYYVSLDASYQINERWAVEGGVQFEDIDQFAHNFGGREVDLDLSRSLFVQVGVSYSF